MARMLASNKPALRPGLGSLKKRAEFLRVRGGSRCAMSAFVLEGKARASDLQGGQQPRFGFTVTKRLGKAVQRNRIKRRLKAAAKKVCIEHADPAFDYVLIARSAALEVDFTELAGDLAKALKRVHKMPRHRSPGAEQ
jgi:ribonuclease P protein component